MEQKAVLKDLGDGLVMRRSTRADADRLAAFNARIHGEDPQDAQAVGVWTRDLLSGAHPTFGVDDFTIVEDRNSGEIVSSMNLISQTWAYEGIPFGVGRPELVGTDPNYRARGLVRAQFEVAHEWSRQRGEQMQVITGIPYFYRQFGYEMGLELGGGRSGGEAHLPKLADDQQEPYAIRPAEEADLPFVLRLYQRSCRRSMISAVWDEALLRHEIFEKSQENVNRQEVCVIETADGQPVGYLAHPGGAWSGGTMMTLTAYELDAGVSYLAVNPTIIRYLWRIGQVFARARERTLTSFGFWLGAGPHPAYTASAGRLVQESKPYAFYVRVPDLPAFLRCIGPVLEARLADSACAGHTGELKISFYREGIRLVFEHGKLAAAEPWKPVIGGDGGMAAFPNLTFLQLVLGYRTLDELRYAYADCSASDDARALLSGLFHKKPSKIWGIS